MESLVKWVKANFLAGRIFADDADLERQNADWLIAANARPSQATNEPPDLRLPREAAKGGKLPSIARDYALLESAYVSGDSTVPVLGNVYSVPLGHLGAPVSVRVHAQRIRIYRDARLLADHARAPDGAHARVIEPTHFAPVFPKKARAQAMLYRDALLKLDGEAAAYVAEVSRRRRDRLRAEILELYALFERHGAERLVGAMAVAQGVGAYGAEYIRALLAEGAPRAVVEPRLRLVVPDVPGQEEVDRLLSSYEVFVEGVVVAGGQT